MPLSKPPGIEPDAFESAKWDEITAGRDFAPSDAPTLALLCQWCKVVHQAMGEPANLCNHATPLAARTLSRSRLNCSKQRLQNPR